MQLKNYVNIWRASLGLRTMVKRILVSFIITLFATGVFAGIGDWHLFPSYHNATYCEVAGERIYVLASGALYSYNRNDNELRTYDKTFLNDIDITDIAYSKQHNALIIIYKNANIDILYDDEDVYNIPDFKNKLIPNKKINSIEIQGDYAYISTEFGILVFNIERLEFSNTYNLDKNTYCSYLFKDKMYAGTSDGLYSCDTIKNLLDKNNWEKINDNRIYRIAELDGNLYMLNDYKSIDCLDKEYNIKEIIKSSGNFQTIYNYNDRSNNHCFTRSIKGLE